ncbi:zinc finger domain containing protein [Entamoeba histolytica HM-1:IMSS-B]|uniref:Zinc finger domain containing protein n=1 Tax=Entamoeba histolytica HM-1:IMSS-B TaxID=885319 RepID=M3TJG4_ENTH1|nr:zinc finger domain containing protein [Entamoeba histolytica HM-1:IMSS-B]
MTKNNIILLIFIILFTNAERRQITTVQTPLTLNQPYKGIWVKPDEVSLNSTLKSLSFLTEPVGTFYLTSLIAIEKDSKIRINGKMFIRNGFYMDKEIQTLNLTCIDLICQLEGIEMTIDMKDGLLYGIVSDEQLKFIGKTFFGKQSNLITETYIILSILLFIISFNQMRKVSIDGIALHILTMGDAYCALLHTTATFVFHPSSSLFYGFGIISILSICQVAVMGSKYLGRYGAIGQIYMTCNLLVGFFLAEYWKFGFIIIICSPWLFNDKKTNKTRLITLCLKGFMMSYWVGYSDNPINIQNDWSCLFVLWLSIAIQFKINNNHHHLVFNENKTTIKSKLPCDCPICLCLIEDSNDVLLTKCSHIFHKECIQMWLKEHDDCPYCRTTLLLN